MMTSILNFLAARKTPNVKWHKIIKADMAAETPNPWEPYANRHIGKPIFPVLGITNGGNSLIISFVFCKYKKIIPTIKKKAIAIK